MHEDAFHEEDRLIEGLPGETLLRWDLAKYVTEMSGDIRQARRRMDEVLDFKGNVFSQGVASCCIGCATWQKSFNLAPRLSLSLVLGSMFFAYVPWGFPSFLALLGRGGVALKIASGSAAIAFATSGLLIQLRALGRANAFMSKYQANIPAFQPLVQFSKSSPKTTTYENILFSTVWDPLL